MGFKAKFLEEKARYITGILLIILAVVVLWINHVILFWGVLGVVYVLGFYEALELYQKTYHLKFGFWYFVGAVCVWILGYFAPIESALFMGVFVAGFLAYKALDMRFVLPFIYPSLPFLCLFALFKDFGVRVVAWLVVVVVLADVGAYFGGRWLGSIRLSPTSPKKTLEGALIGFMLASLIGGLVGIAYLGFIKAFLVSIVVALSAILGDLFESYLKRVADVKDSGFVLPGHGGILDRLDAMLFAGVSMYFCLNFKLGLLLSFL
ncbi:phosphatidate cytidylyltransferase [Helicobacter suis]|uniref:phosphatidate cytidylyltransferase n=1 Tax=Helicobacter suis TaxID=104628 RepID=UPI0013D7A43D|nr:phosphatidate cytidylyltransferase [Helicobacter suis]